MPILYPFEESFAIEGHIYIVYYWIEGMTNWENLETYPYPAKVGDDIHLAVYWKNDGSAAAVGHIIAQLTAPSFNYYVPSAVLNQDKSADPGNGWGVQFAPVTLNESGFWSFFGRLDLDDVEWVDYKNFTFAVEVVEEPPEPSINIKAANFPQELEAGEIPTVKLIYDVIAPVDLIQLLVRIYDIATGALVCETNTMHHTTGSYEWNIPSESWLSSMPARTWNLRTEIVRWWP